MFCALPFDKLFGFSVFSLCLYFNGVFQKTPYTALHKTCTKWYSIKRYIAVPDGFFLSIALKYDGFDICYNFWTIILCIHKYWCRSPDLQGQWVLSWRRGTRMSDNAFGLHRPWSSRLYVYRPAVPCGIRFGGWSLHCRLLCRSQLRPFQFEWTHESASPRHGSIGKKLRFPRLPFWLGFPTFPASA